MWAQVPSPVQASDARLVLFPAKPRNFSPQLTYN
jgi:hypothetical protein